MPGGYDSAAGSYGWMEGIWGPPGPDESAGGEEIRLAQSPQWGLTIQSSFFSAAWPQVVVQQSDLHKWIRKLDGTIALAAKPSLVLAVDGDLGAANARIVVATEDSMPPQAAMWKVDKEGRIMLEHSPHLGLSVPHGSFEDGSPAKLANVTALSAHNQFRLAAMSGGALHAATPSKLRVTRSRGDPNTLWTSLTGAITYQQGYIAVSQGHRDAESNSSWTYVTENLGDPQIGLFVKEPSGGGGFLLKLIEKGGKSSKEARYLSCEEELSADRRTERSTWAYVSKKDKASIFQEEFCKEGLVLKSGDGYLCSAKFKDRPTEYGTDSTGSEFTWLYTVKDAPHLAACVSVEPAPAAKKPEPWWKSFMQKYWTYIRYVLIALGVLVLIWIIWAIAWHFRARDEQQILIPYDCHHQPEHMWSKTKVAWCCEHWALGCPSSTEAPATGWAAMVPGPVPGAAGGAPVHPPATAEDDCFTGALHWQRDWTISKQNFCCENHGIGCKAAMTTPAFDCDEDYHKWTVRWSYQKKLWCCLHKERGCPASGQATVSFDCVEGYEDPDSWGEDKREWCCYHASVGCPQSSPMAKYDCDAGYNNWLNGWSEGKKVWCCFHAGRACSTEKDEEYDCDAGFANWQVGWSNSKMDFCCQTQQKGCSHVV